MTTDTQGWSLKAAAAAPPKSTFFTLIVGGAYVLAYVVLDWVSYIHPVAPLAITVWNPPPGLSLALLLGFGLRYAPALFLAAFLAEVTVRPGDAAIGDAAAYAAILAAGYTAVAAWLHSARFDPSFRSLRDLVLFVTVVGVGTIGIGLCYVAAHALTGSFAWSRMADYVLHFWVGDVIGIATTTPFLLIARARLARGRKLKLTTEGALQAASIVAVLALVFRLDPEGASRLFYLLFLPLVWISTRHGFEGATAGLLATQLGLIGALQLANYPTPSVLQFQLLMLALTITGAFLGMTSTQWRVARQSLESREAELKTVVATAPDAIVRVDGARRIIDVNDAAAAMFAVARPRLRGQPLSSLIPELRDSDLTCRAAAFRARRADGVEFPVEVSFGSAMVDGRPVHIGVVRDVGQRREMEEKLRERDQHLDRSLRAAAAAEMASALAHEVNQPLTAASSYMQALDLLLARRATNDPELTETMRKASAEVTRAGRIVRQLREFYRRDPGNVEAVRADALVEQALASLGSRMELHQIAVTIKVAADLPGLLVDPFQIEIVLHNLLRNAVDSIAEAQPAVRQITVDARRGTGGFAEISVSDSGPGVNASVADLLFRSFVSSRVEGMGLGLAISRSIVERHGGRLWLEPGGTGARFVLTLPTAPDRG
jgi:two-component system, LuxR family, sensor kinase FixL